MKRLAVLIVLLIALSALTVSASAKIVEGGLQSPYRIIVDDSDDLLTDEEERALVEDMRPISAYGTVVFLTSHGGSGSNDERALSYLNANVSRDRGFSVTMFRIDIKGRQIHLFSRGALERTVTVSNAYTITNNVSRLATGGHYYQCAASAFSQVYGLINTGRVASPMRWICSALLALAGALFAAFKLIQRDETERRKRLVERAYSSISSNVDIRNSGCHCGISHLTILPDGSVMACRRVRDSVVGNALADELADLWNGPMDAYRQCDRFQRCAGCRLLPWCRGCPAVAAGTNGSFYAPDPQCWRVVE